MIDNRNLALLSKLGIIVDHLEATPLTKSQYWATGEIEEPPVEYTGTFRIDESRFVPMCHLIRFTDMICENKNPQVQKMYEELLTMLYLTEEHK